MKVDSHLFLIIFLKGLNKMYYQFAIKYIGLTEFPKLFLFICDLKIKK